MLFSTIGDSCCCLTEAAWNFKTQTYFLDKIPNDSLQLANPVLDNGTGKAVTGVRWRDFSNDVKQMFYSPTGHSPDSNNKLNCPGVTPSGAYCAMRVRGEFANSQNCPPPHNRISIQKATAKRKICFTECANMEVYISGNIEQHNTGFDRVKGFPVPLLYSYQDDSTTCASVRRLEGGQTVGLAPFTQYELEVDLDSCDQYFHKDAWWDVEFKFTRCCTCPCTLCRDSGNLYNYVSASERSSMKLFDFADRNNRWLPVRNTGDYMRVVGLLGCVQADIHNRNQNTDYKKMVSNLQEINTKYKYQTQIDGLSYVNQASNQLVNPHYTVNDCLFPCVYADFGVPGSADYISLDFNVVASANIRQYDSKNHFCGGTATFHRHGVLGRDDIDIEMVMVQGTGFSNIHSTTDMYVYGIINSGAVANATNFSVSCAPLGFPNHSTDTTDPANVYNHVEFDLFSKHWQSNCVTVVDNKSCELTNIPSQFLDPQCLAPDNLQVWIDAGGTVPPAWSPASLKGTLLNRFNCKCSDGKKITLNRVPVRSLGLQGAELTKFCKDMQKVGIPYVGNATICGIKWYIAATLFCNENYLNSRSAGQKGCRNTFEESQSFACGNKQISITNISCKNPYDNKNALFPSASLDLLTNYATNISMQGGSETFCVPRPPGILDGEWDSIITDFLINNLPGTLCESCPPVFLRVNGIFPSYDETITQTILYTAGYDNNNKPITKLRQEQFIITRDCCTQARCYCDICRNTMDLIITE